MWTRVRRATISMVFFFFFLNRMGSGAGTCSLLSFLASVVRHAGRRFRRKLCGQGSVAQPPIPSLVVVDSVPFAVPKCRVKISGVPATPTAPPRGQPLALTCFLFYFRFCCCNKTPSTESKLGDNRLFAFLRLSLKTLALHQGPG